MLSRLSLLRRRCSKWRVFIVFVAFTFLLYLSTLLVGSIHIPKIFKLTELNRCPACYGVSVCPELYSGQIILDNNDLFSLSSYMNAKNIYYGRTKSNVRVVLKKLAHDSELTAFDNNLCKGWNLSHSCFASDLLNLSKTYIEMKIKQSVRYDWMSPPVTPRKGLVFCPYEGGIMDFVKIHNKPVQRKDKSVGDKADMLNVWTLLSLNPEPIVLQHLPRSKGWQVPKYGGVCGRVELVGYAGAHLASLPLDLMPWLMKLHYVKQILDAAMDFTFKHERYRFYLMDWTLDNIAVNEKDEISFVDLEDLIILDKHAQPNKSMPHWYKRYLREPSHDKGFFFSIQNNCMHHLSDHNLYGACYVIAGGDNPLIHRIPGNPKDIKLVKMLDDCLKGNGDRFRIVTTLQNHIANQLRLGGFPIGQRSIK